jgi:hypothetical protein
MRSTDRTPPTITGFFASDEFRRRQIILWRIRFHGPKSDEEKKVEKKLRASMEERGREASFQLTLSSAVIAVPILLLIHFVLNLHKLRAWFRLVHSTRSVTSAPPLVADYVLCLFLSRRNKSETIGDLTEEFHEEIEPTFGLKAAKFWYWKKALSAVVERNPIVRKFLIGGGVLKAAEMIWKLVAG